MKILVVDDEAFGRDSLRMVLKACGHEVLTAADGPAAIEIVQSCDVDAAIVDCFLGHPMDGLELARRLRAYSSKMRLVLISGRSELSMESIAGLDVVFLAKPFQVDELLPLLQTQQSSSANGQ